jgi:hypothetical protein
MASTFVSVVALLVKRWAWRYSTITPRRGHGRDGMGERDKQHKHHKHRRPSQGESGSSPEGWDKYNNWGCVLGALGDLLTGYGWFSCCPWVLGVISAAAGGLVYLVVRLVR